MFNTIRQNLRAFLRIPENLTAGLPTISASLPTASLGGSPPELQLVRPAQVVAAPAQAQASAAPKFRHFPPAPVDHEGFTLFQRKMQHEARLKTEFGLHEKLEVAGMKSEARRKVLADFDRFVAARPLGKTAAPAPATDDDGSPQAPPADSTADVVSDVIQKLQECLQQLKTLHPDVPSDDADADEAQARASLAAGRKSEALRYYDAAISKLGAKIAAKKSRSALLSEPSSRGRAQRLTSQGFNADPVVASLNAALGRRPLADRAGMVLAPVGATTAPARPAAVATTTSAAPDVAKIRALQTEIAEIDADYRKTGVYPPAAQARHATLSRQLKAEMRKFHLR